jgi:RNA polymerase sigma factor (sigma-70 family)
MQHTATDLNILVEGCKQEQAAAQKALVQRMAPTLLSVARRYARTASAANDIVQDSFIAIFKHIRQHTPEKGAPAAWMRRIVINTALSHYRNRRFQCEYSSDVLPDTPDNIPDAIARLSFEEICTLIQALPDGAREVFNMAVFDDFSHEDIAAALKIPVGTSRSLLSRARQLLKEKIKNIHAHELAGIGT